MYKTWTWAVSASATAVLVMACGKSPAPASSGGGGDGSGNGGGSGSGGSGSDCQPFQVAQCAELLDCCNSVDFPEAIRGTCQGIANSECNLCEEALGTYQNAGSCVIPDGGYSDAPPPDAPAPGCPLGFTPSNIGKADFCDMYPQPYANIVITADCSFEGGSSSNLCTGLDQIGYVKVDQGNGAPAIDVYIASSWTIAAGATVTLDGSGPLALVARSTIDVEGTIVANNGYTFSGAGKGKGPGGGGAGSATTAGGGGGFCGAGGTGAAFAGGTASKGGAVYGTQALVPLLPGSTGGSDLMYAGDSGGAIQLVAGESVTIGTTGVITAPGLGGDGPAGGGSGGAILIESPVVTCDGTLAANGGGGGGEGALSVGASLGASGMPNAKPAPGGKNGGKGSAGATVAGGAGQCPAASCVSTNMADNPGGGGGGAGRIRINTMGGSASLAGVSSPALTSACVTQGTIAP